MGKYHLQPQEFGIRYQQGWPDGVNVKHVGLHPLGLVDGPKRVDDSLKGLLFGCRDIDEVHTVPLGERVMHIALAPDNGHLMASRGNPREELLAVSLHATHDAGYASCTCYYYLHCF